MNRKTLNYLYAFGSIGVVIVIVILAAFLEPAPSKSPVPSPSPKPALGVPQNTAPTPPAFPKCIFRSRADEKREFIYYIKRVEKLNDKLRKRYKWCNENGICFYDWINWGSPSREWNGELGRARQEFEACFGESLFVYDGPFKETWASLAASMVDLYELWNRYSNLLDRRFADAEEWEIRVDHELRDARRALNENR